jgi:hypothetical protein
VRQLLRVASNRGASDIPWRRSSAGCGCAFGSTVWDGRIPLEEVIRAAPHGTMKALRSMLL